MIPAKYPNRPNFGAEPGPLAAGPVAGTQPPGSGRLSMADLVDQADLSPEDRAKVLQALQGVPMKSNEAFPAEVNARLPVANNQALENIGRVPAEFKEKAQQLLDVAYRAATAGQRVMWIRRAADALAEGYGPVSACRSGCAHCCHIPVKISLPEAQVLGKAIGRKPVAPANHGPAPAEQEPCSFLRAGQCSVYSERPAVCRGHMNMDVDELLCRPVPGAGVPVPYLDVTPVYVARVATGGRTSYADIRQWFPRVQD